MGALPPTFDETGVQGLIRLDMEIGRFECDPFLAGNGIITCQNSHGRFVADFTGTVQRFSEADRVKEVL